MNIPARRSHRVIVGAVAALLFASVLFPPWYSRSGPPPFTAYSQGLHFLFSDVGGSIDFERLLLIWLAIGIAGAVAYAMTGAKKPS